MARFVFFHNALGKTDGVSLEVDKWRWCLEQLGHEVFYCAGNDDVEGVHCIPELDFFHPETRKILENATVELKDYTELELEQAISCHAAVIKKQLMEYLDSIQADCLIPNNLLSVGYHLPALVALSEVIEESGIPTIAHNHDFYFEDSGEVNPTCDVAWSILDRYSPPVCSNVINLVINRIAQEALLSRKDIQAQVVPNVFDFNQPSWEVDEYNADFRTELGIGENDIVFLQATRVMDRKGVELAIDVVGEVTRRRSELDGKELYSGRVFSSQDRIILLCAGRVEQFGISGNYQEALENRAQKQGVELLFVGERVKHSRGEHAEHGKTFSLWDSYVHSDFVTYPSWWEGWGNQFIEAIFAKLPVVLFEYPVFQSDLKDDGFRVVSLGSELIGPDEQGLYSVSDEIVKGAAQDVIPLILDGERREQVVSANYEIAKERYSYEVLQEIIQDLLERSGVK